MKKSNIFNSKLCNFEKTIIMVKRMPTLLFKANEELSIIREIFLDYKTRSWFSIIQNFKTLMLYMSRTTLNLIRLVTITFT